MKPYKFLRENRRYSKNHKYPVVNWDFASLYAELPNTLDTSISNYIFDIEYLQNQMFVAMKIPSRFFSMENANKILNIPE